GNCDFRAGVDLGGLQYLARGIALDGWFGIGDFAYDDGGQRNRDGATFVEHDFDRHAFFQVVQGVAHAFGFDFVLVVFFVHENVHGIGEIGVGALLVVEHDDFELFVGLVHGFAAGGGKQVLELQLDDGGVAA